MRILELKDCRELDHERGSDWSRSAGRLLELAAGARQEHGRRVGHGEREVSRDAAALAGAGRATRSRPAPASSAMALAARWSPSLSQEHAAGALGSR
jgi:hypothetical protein